MESPTASGASLPSRGLSASQGQGRSLFLHGGNEEGPPVGAASHGAQDRLSRGFSEKQMSSGSAGSTFLLHDEGGIPVFALNNVFLCPNRNHCVLNSPRFLTPHGSSTGTEAGLQPLAEAQTQVEHTENTELPLTLLEKHNPWPAYVTHTSLAVRRLIDKSRVRELECTRAAEESHKSVKLSKTSFMLLKRKKSSKFSELVLKDALSGSRLSTWEHSSATNTSPTFLPEPEQLQMEAREGPTLNYNKIIFSKRPALRKLPYALLQDSKDTNAKG